MLSTRAVSCFSGEGERAFGLSDAFGSRMPFIPHCMGCSCEIEVVRRVSVVCWNCGHEMNVSASDFERLEAECESCHGIVEL